MKSKTIIILIGSFFVTLLVLLIVNASIRPEFAFFINGSEEVYQSVLEDYHDNGATSYYKNSIFSSDELKVKTSNEVDTSKLGTYYVTYKVKYKNKTYTKTRTVNVVDLTSPVININNKIVNMCEGKKVDDFKYIALDNYDGNITKNVEEKMTKKYLILTVKDSSGNVTNKKVKLNNLDLSIPSITLNGEDIVNLNVNDEYKEKGATATNSCDGDISSLIEVTSNVDTTKAGNYTVTYKVTDRFGNSNQIERKVNVS